MKKIKGFGIIITICIVAVLCAGMPVTANAATAKSKAMEAYRAMLSKNSITCPSGVKAKTSTCSFAIAYIDNNSVPELIVYNPNACHASGYGAIYTYKNGKVVEIRDLECYAGNFSYYKKTGTFRDYYFGNGGWLITYVYTLSSGKASMKLRETVLDSSMRGFYPNAVANNWVKISKNGKETKITKAAYKKSLKSLANNKKSTKAKFYKNTANNRKKILK